MDKKIIEAVGQFNGLSVRENVGSRFRVTKTGLKGSLWLQPQRQAYRLKLTGDVRSKLSSYVSQEVGPPSHEDQGNPVWHIPLTGVMESILDRLDSL